MVAYVESLVHPDEGDIPAPQAQESHYGSFHRKASISSQPSTLRDALDTVTDHLGSHRVFSLGFMAGLEPVLIHAPTSMYPANDNHFSSSK